MPDNEQLIIMDSVSPAAKRRTLGSVVVPAHNEAAVIGRCLDALFEDVEADELDVIVVCNGCQDSTAEVARTSGHDVRVIELPEPSKSAALRAGDRAARAFPRLYLDADVVLKGSSARRILQHLGDGAVAARPPIHYDTDRASGPVRSYYRARSKMPAVLRSLWGAGVYGVSAAGRGRFDAFPDLGADDLWIDGQFEPTEIDIVPCDPVRVAVPRRSRDLLRTLRRTYRGKAETRGGPAAVRRSRGTTVRALGDLSRLCLRSPVSGLDAAIYAWFAIGARVLFAAAQSGRPPGAGIWERDDTSRRDEA